MYIPGAVRFRRGDRIKTSEVEGNQDEAKLQNESPITIGFLYCNPNSSPWYDHFTPMMDDISMFKFKDICITSLLRTNLI